MRTCAEGVDCGAGSREVAPLRLRLRSLRESGLGEGMGAKLGDAVASHREFLGRGDEGTWEVEIPPTPDSRSEQ